MSSSNHGNNSRGNPGNLESNKPINSQKYIGRRSRKLTKDGREEESIVLDERVSLTSSTTSIISPSTAKKARKNISSSNTLNPGNSIDVIEDNCSLPSLTSESKTGHKLPSNSSKEHKDSKIGTGIDSRRRSSRLAKKAPFQNPSSASGINYSLLSISSSSSSSTTGNTDFIPATASVSSNTNKRNRKLSRGSREEETALDEKVTPVSGSSSLISPSSTKKARKNIALSTSTSSSCPPLSSVNTSKTSNNKDNTHLATTNTSRSSKNSRVSVVLGSGSSCTGSVKSTFNLEDTIAALQDNNSLTSVPSENKTGHKIGSNSSKERKDLDTGSYTSSRRRSSRLASKFPTQNASSASGVSYSSSIGSSLSSVAAGLSSCEASTSNTKHLSSQHSGSQDMEETNAGSTRKDITSSKFSEVSGLGANNTSSLMKSVTGRGSSTGAGVGMNTVVGSGSSSATSNVSAGGGSSSGLPLSSSMSRTSGGLDSESDDNEMGRLQALLEARGLPPHLFSALGPRVHHILHRSMGNKASSKAHQLIQGLQAQGDEGQQLQAVMEMCQLLVMGNEDTLAGFPAKQAVPALIALLQLEQNFDIMNHSCRALTYMMESLPRSSAIVVDAIPAFLEKLQFIQCMDVAEQSLTALEMLSRRHSKAILHAGGVPACLSYLDFFTINAQRAALSITANCCQNLSKDEFSFVRESLSTLSSHLIKYQDKKCLESLCLAFSRLVDSFQHHSDILEQITGDNLLANVQQLLLVSPPIISTGTFVMVIRMLATMCVSCPKLAVQLLKLNISDTIRYLLLGPSATSEYIELATRSPQELYEITSLIGELMPKLPNDGIFSVDMLWTKQVHVINNGVTWQWKDDRGMWHNYSALDSKMMEAAHQANEDEISLSTMGRTYIIDFNSMQQINEDTGTSRSIQRLVNSNASSSTSPLSSCATTLGGGGGGGSTAESDGLSSISGLSSVNEDARIKCLKEEPELAETFVKSLFGVLYEVYSSSAGPSVRHKCIRALLRIIYYSSSDILRVVLKNHAVSSHIAAMLPSPDLRVVVGAIQMVYILMEKLPDIFSIYFRREGVIHQLKRIIQSESSESIGCGGRGVASLSSSPSTSSPLNAMATSPNKLSTNIKLEPQAGPSTPTSGSVYGQNYSSQCYLESSSSLSNLPSLQPHSSSCDVPPVLFTSSAASERYHAANMSNTANTNHSLSMQVWDNSSAIPDSSPCASAQSLASLTASHHHLSSQVAAVAAAAAAAAATAAAISSSTRCSDSVEARSSQSKLNDVLKRKRSSKKGNTNSLSGSTQSSSSSALANRKSRNDMESSLSVHYKNCISSPPATSLSSTNRVDYDSVSASLNPQLLSSPYISMPFFAYSANTRSPSMNNASTATSFSSNTNNMISTSNSLIGINNNNNSNNVNSSNICIAGGSNSSSHTGLNALGPSSTISMPISSATSNPILVSGGPVTGRGRSSKFSSAAAKTSSFFANLYPARWRRWSNANPTIIGSNGSGNLSGNRKSMLISQSQDQLGHVSGSSSSASPRSPHNNGNKEKVRQWIKEQAKIFVEKYFDNDNESNEAMSTLNRINGAMEIFEQGNDLEALKEFKSVLLQGDISPFELIHCGMINKLINHLTHIGEGREEERDARIRRFLHVFIGTPADDLTVINNETDLKLETGPLTSLVVKLNACISQLEQFPVRVHDVIGTGTGNIRGTSALKFFNTHQLKCNLQRHRDCTNLKQWRGGPVKIDPLALVQAIERYLLLRGYGRVKEDDDENSDDDNSDEDFDDNMAKVVMNQGQGRHKLQFLIDDHILPFNMTVYQAIRQFSSGANSQSNDGHETDTDFDAPMGHTNMWVQTHTIYYRQYVEPESLSSSGGSGLGAGSPSYCVASGSGVSASSPSSSSCPNMSTMNVCSSSTSPSSSSSASASVQMSNHNCSGLAANNGHSYSSTPSSGGSGSSSNSGPGIGSGSSGPGAGNSGRRSSKSSCSKNSAPKKKDELWLEGKAPMVSSTVYNNLSAKLPSCVTICDASLEVMNLLRIVNALNRSWGWFYHLTLCQNPAIPQSEFVNSKLTAKANRQLQDPLVIMTGNLPQWLSQIAYVCPFLFPFETRHLLFYITSFDRDRALQRLLDTTPGLNSNDSSERVTPRLDKRKKTVTREDILRQAESVFHDVGNSKALLEIQYENEVGTGLGPTLEFYALVSKELQRADLDMWRGEAITSSSVIMPISYSNDKGSSGSSHSEEIQIIQLLKNNDGIKEKLHQQYHHHHISQQQLHQAIQYIYSTEGLFPQPISKSTKTTALSKIKSRYKLLGKFMAKALCDSRMVDLPLSIPFYKWLLGQELTLNVTDLHFIDATLAKSVINMDLIAQRKKLLERGISGHTRETLTMSGVAIEDLALDFTLPGFPNIELRKGGKDMSVTLDNIDQYLRLMIHWTMVEGVSRQMEAFKEGFESVLPLSQLQIFYPEELEQLFCGSSHQTWDIKTLIDCCHPDHGYTYDSRAIKFLFEVLSTYNAEEQRKFLQFVTGSPRLPVGGLKSLSPPLTVVRKTFEPGENPDNYLPSVMTCVNYLKLPDYSSIEVMREKLMLAANEGQHSFHLS